MNRLKSAQRQEGRGLCGARSSHVEAAKQRTRTLLNGGMTARASDDALWCIDDGVSAHVPDFGSRYLQSTGQVYKDGPNGGCSDHDRATCEKLPIMGK
jgi:hypothetical protein